MKSKSTFKLWQPAQQPHRMHPSGSLSKLRKSLENVKSLRYDLFKLRTSFSNASLSYIHYLSPLKKNSSATLLHCNKSQPLFFPKANPNNTHNSLKHKLDLIAEKLKQAKKSIETFHDNDAKTIRKLADPQLLTSYETKESLLQTQRLKQKSKLATYTAVSSKPHNVRPISTNPYIHKSRYYLGEVTRAIHEKNSLAMEHINQTMQMLLQYKLFKIGQDFMEDEESIELPYLPGCQGKKTLILDLDETLIHCFQRNESKPDIQLTINIDGFPIEIGFNIRPYAISFLKKMKKHWEIIIFTASHQSYADTILDQLDSEGELFDHRLYRQHCRELTTDLFVKDLSKINRDLSKVVLVDNSAYSYAMQLDNGIPILPFYEGKDYELTALEHYIHRLYESNDVREVNREYFQLHRYTSFDNACSLVQELYGRREQ